MKTLAGLLMNFQGAKGLFVMENIAEAKIE